MTVQTQQPAVVGAPPAAAPLPQVPADWEKYVRDTVQASTANHIASAIEVAKDAAARAVKEGGIAELIGKASSPDDLPRATVRDGQLVNDPLKGKGLKAARAFRALAVGLLDRRPAYEVARRWAKENPVYVEVAESLEKHERAFSAGSISAGGALIPPEMASEIIELLYAQTVALAMGVRTMEFTASISLGRINSGSTVGYTGEQGLMVPSQPGTGELRLAGKKAYGLVPMTNELLRNPAVGADAIVRDDLVRALALRRDLSVYRGLGNSFQPKGIDGWINSNNVFAQTGTTTASKIGDFIKLIRLVDESNIGVTEETSGFVFTPRTKWALYSTVDANSNLVFAAMLAAGNLFGFKNRTTTQIPNNLGGGTNESMTYFGNHGDVVLGFDQVTPLQVEAFPNGTFHDGTALVSGISTDQTPVRLLEGHDVAMRHDNTFAKLTQQTIT